MSDALFIVGKVLGGLIALVGVVYLVSHAWHSGKMRAFMDYTKGKSRRGN